MRDRTRRATALVLVVAALAGAGTAERLVGRTGASGPSVDHLAAVAGAVSSAGWYCAGGAAAPAGSQVSVSLTNAGTEPATATVQPVLADASPPASQTVTVAPGGDVQVALPGPAAARVIVSGGRVGALETVSGPGVWTTSACASQVSDHWYFAYGSTASHTLDLALFNPTATDAVVDVAFTSDSGQVVQPPAYQGMALPAQSATVLDVGDHLPDDPSIGTVVTTLSGSVVADEMSVIGGPGDGGISLVAGTPRPRTQWGFAYQVDDSSIGLVVDFHVFNPGTSPVRVAMTVALPAGQAAPLELTVPPMGALSVVGNDQTRIPQKTPYGAVFDASAPVLVEREVVAAPSPAGANHGIFLAAAGGIRRWLVPVPPPPGGAVWTLSVVSLGVRPAHLTIAARASDGRWVALRGQDAVTVARGVLLTMHGVPPVGDVPLQVSSDEPVVVELEAEPIAQPGFGVVPAWPFDG